MFLKIGESVIYTSWNMKCWFTNNQKNLEAAALKTFTGKWAKSKGYGKPELYDADNQFRNIKDLGDIELVTDIVFVFKK